MHKAHTIFLSESTAHFFGWYGNFFWAPTVCALVGTNWQASEASETLSGMYKFELVRYIYMYGGTCSIIVAHATYT